MSILSHIDGSTSLCGPAGGLPKLIGIRPTPKQPFGGELFGGEPFGSEFMAELLTIEPHRLGVVPRMAAGG